MKTLGLPTIIMICLSGCFLVACNGDKGGDEDTGIDGIDEDSSVDDVAIDDVLPDDNDGADVMVEDETTDDIAVEDVTTEEIPGCADSVLGCGSSLLDETTIGEIDSINDYGCVELNESGGERVYGFSTPRAQDVTINIITGGADLDLFVLTEPCDAGTCMAYGVDTGATESVFFTATAAATYYIVVDGWNGASDTYSISVACAEPNPCDRDRDGHESSECGGDDCDDDDPTTYTGAHPIACSETDHDCDDLADGDGDGDGHIDITCPGGDDCNDENPTFFSGCWYDPTTGYRWENPPGWVPGIGEQEAYCNSLSLAGFGSGQWKVPSGDEYRSLIRGCPATETGGACDITDSCLDCSCGSDCGGCTSGGGPGIGGCYWDPALEGSCSLPFPTEPTCSDVMTCFIRNVDFSTGAVRHSDCLSVYGPNRALRCVHTGS